MTSIGLLLAVIRVGIIGLDTSHATAFTKHLNDPDGTTPEFRDFRVVAAVVKGSATIPSSVAVQPNYTEAVRKLGVEIVPDVAALLPKVDAVLLETNDGREHLWQAEACFRAGKRVFIDKPLAHNLKDSKAIVDLAKKHNATFFTSSAIRYVKSIRYVKEKGFRVRGMDCWTCFNYEPSHDRWYWYGIHCVDPLFAVMGRGCEEVVSFSGADGEIAIGRWKDGRFGVARGLATTKKGAPYGGVIFTEDAKVGPSGEKLIDGQINMGTYEGYAEELKFILQYFRTGEVPVAPEESLEVLAFMTAADLSAQRGGAPVTLAEAVEASSDAPWWKFW